MTSTMKMWTEEYSTSDLLIYEDKDIIVVNKPSGINTQDDQTGDLSLMSWIEKIKNRRLHIINRIDRPVSGIVLFSKNKIGNQLYNHQQELSKEYLAITKTIEPREGELKHFLFRDGRRKKAYVSEEKKPSYKECHLSYKTIHELDNYNVISIETHTGRFHQIRAQLAHIKVPIRGDVKYGARRANKDRSIDLHAYKMTIPSMDKVFSVAPIGRENIWKEISSLDIFEN